jgi:alkylated DNA repair dioxygenase AlkB
MHRQLDLLAPQHVGFDASLSELRRAALADGAWVDHVPVWVTGHDLLFEQLERSLAWRTETRRMYDRKVATPRLLATIAATEVAGGVLEAMRRALSARYGEDFVRVTAALYRDGNDSVAWHGDKIGRSSTEDTMVAIVSLGATRVFALRPHGGGKSLRLAHRHGDLLVMGGSCQRTWEHSIPKTTRPVGPRISIQFRPHDVR